MVLDYGLWFMVYGMGGHLRTVSASSEMILLFCMYGASDAWCLLTITGMVSLFDISAIPCGVGCRAQGLERSLSLSLTVAWWPLIECLRHRLRVYNGLSLSDSPLVATDRVSRI